MLVLTRYRILNKYNFWVFALFLASMLFIMYFETHLNQVNPFTFDPQLYHIENLPLAEQEEYRLNLYNILIKFEYYAYAACGSIIMALPILSCSTVWTFFQEKKGLFVYQYSRGQHKNVMIIRSILINAFIKAVYFYLSYVIYLIIGVLISNKTKPDLDLNLFDKFFGVGFGNAHQVIYFLLIGIIQVFLFSLTYCIFSYSICLVCRKPYLAFIIPITYCFAGSFLFLTTNEFSLEFLRPGFTTALTAYSGFPLWWSFSPLIIPLITSILLIHYSLKRTEIIGT